MVPCDDRPTPERSGADAAEVPRIMGHVISLMFDGFKGSIGAPELGGMVRAELAPHCPDVEIVNFPCSDGGDGFVAALACHVTGERVACRIADPLGRARSAEYLWSGQERLAIIESAEANGLALIADNERDPLRTTTWGVGELLLDAARRGARRILIGVGGSATSDGGIGMAQALGFTFTAQDGRRLGPLISDCVDVCRIEPPSPHPLTGIEIVVACDVFTKLFDAVHIYGPQKGGTPDSLAIIERNLRALDALVVSSFGREYAELVMGGAAGGLAAGLALFADATLRHGMELFDELTGLERQIQRSNLVITGEGQLDVQSALGKVVSHVSHQARLAGVPVIALCGSAAGHNVPLDAVICLTDSGLPLADCIAHPRNALELIIPRLAELIHSWLLR